MSSVGEVSTDPGVASAASGWRRDLVIAATYLGSAILGGIAAGFFIGGIGSRIAMFVLRMTTGDSVVGRVSDDGFEIGRLSGDTFFLLLFGTALGAAGGVVYLLTRPWIPAVWRWPAFGLLGALFGGAVIVHADGIDFRSLQPVPLAVVMFVALPGLGAAAIAALVEGLLRRRGGMDLRRVWLAFLPLVGLAVLGPVGLAIVAALPLGVALNQKVPLVSIWTSQPVAWIGRALLLVWAGWAGVALVNDLRGIFG